MAVPLAKTNVAVDEDTMVASGRCPLETRYGMGATILRCGRPAHDAWCFEHLAEYGYLTQYDLNSKQYQEYLAQSEESISK
jgi:hypothetical protein